MGQVGSIMTFGGIFGVPLVELGLLPGDLVVVYRGYERSSTAPGCVASNALQF